MFSPITAIKKMQHGAMVRSNEGKLYKMDQLGVLRWELNPDKWVIDAIEFNRFFSLRFTEIKEIENG